MTSDTEPQQHSALSAARAVLSTSTRLLRTAGYSDAADRIIRQATGATGTPVVVFLGESGRGKSSLVNLLAPDLHGAFSGSDGQGQALYRLVIPAKEDNPDAGAVWVYPDGSRSAPDPEAADPIGVELETRGGLLGDVILLDAPSAGGLAAPQSLLNLKILDAASAAVFITDAGALLSSAEIAYLEQCSAQVESVGVVVTKTDLYPASWQDVVAGNEALIKARIPRLAESFVIGVSSVIANAASPLTDPPMRDGLLDASGLPRLVQALKRDLARAGTAPTANALRMARTALDAGRQTRFTQLAIAEAPAEARAGIMAQRKRLSELKDQQQRWTLDLERDLGDLRAGVMRKAVSALDSWAAQWRSRVQSTPSLRMGKMAQQLTSDIFAELLVLRADLLDDAEEQLGELMHGLFRDIPLPAVLNELLGAGERPADTPHMGSEKSHTGFDPTVAMSVVVGSNMGRAVAALVSSSALTGGVVLTGAAALPVVIPVAVVGAGGWFAVNRFFRQNMLEKNRLQTEIPRLAQAERAVITDYLDSRLRHLKPEIVVAYRAQLQDSLAGLQQLIQESQAQEQLSAQASLQRIEALKHEVALLDKQLADIDASLANLRRP
ncbi:hypothetical protein [Pseudarthrobacter sp. H2]|uniref:hypothetical protein n=1 Tax=Pseudarthrobacter sp. H2 TaxID=3418415 RepID=UPI003CEEBFA6